LLFILNLLSVRNRNNKQKKITFDVKVSSSPFSFVINIFKHFLEVTLQIATYKWSYENISVRRYTLKCLSDCLWLLLMVIATLILIKNSSLTSQFRLPLFQISLYHDSVSLSDLFIYLFFVSFSSFFLHSISWSFVFSHSSSIISTHLQIFFLREIGFEGDFFYFIGFVYHPSYSSNFSFYLQIRGTLWSIKYFVSGIMGYMHEWDNWAQCALIMVVKIATPLKIVEV